MDKATYSGRKASKEISKSFDEMGSKIGDSLSGVFAQLGQFGNVVADLSRTVGESLEGIGKGSNGIAIAITGLGAVAAASLAAAAGLLEMAKSGAELVENLEHISQKTGISIRDLQIFQAAGATVGVSLDDMVTGMRKFGQALTGFGKGAAAQSVLRELGVTSKDTKEALLETADAFQKMDDGPRKASDAIALFGKSGLQMIPLLDKGREGIMQWTAEVDKYGAVIGKDAVQANEKYRESVESLSLQWDKLKVDAETEVLPLFTKLTKAINDNGGLLGTLASAGDAVLPTFGLLSFAHSASSNPAVEQTKQETAAKDALLKKQDELQASLKDMFELQKAGGSAALALEQKRLDLTDAIAAERWADASAIQSQLPELQKAADLEAQRAAHAKQLAASYAAVMASIAAGPAKPFLPFKKSDPTAGIEALFGPQPKKDPLAGAPDIGNDINQGVDFADAFKKQDSLAKPFLDDFYSTWEKRQQQSSDAITASYNDQFGKLLGWYALGEISQQQFNDVSEKLERERQAALKDLRKDQGISTFKDAFSDMFKDTAASGRDFARSLTSDIGDALNSLNAQMAKFVVTGKGLNFKQIGQSLETNLASSLLKKGESSLFGSLGGLLGLGGGSKPDGSNSQNALWVQMATGLGGPNPIGALPLGNLGGLLNLPPSIGGGIPGGNPFGSMFSGGGFNPLSLLGLIPGLAEGGDTQAGRAYVVGEKHPELFIPKTAGTVVPTVSAGQTKLSQTNVNLHIHGVTDADSFRKSQAQISSAMGRAASLGQARNSR